MPKIKSRFKFFLITESSLGQEADELRSRLLKLFLAFDRSELAAEELIFLVIATYCEKRKPGEWWMRGASEFLFKQHPRSEMSVFLRELGFDDTIFNLSDFFKKFRLKNLPISITHVLAQWSQGKINLNLIENVLTPLQMLTCQAQGQRVITLARPYFLNGVLVDTERDAFEFLLHDLTHAHLYFSETHEEQKKFFFSLHEKITREQIFMQELDDPLFEKDLNYIMSDMNSHIAHLKNSLHSALLAQAKRAGRIGNDETLPLAVERRIQEVLSRFES